MRSILFASIAGLMMSTSLAHAEPLRPLLEDVAVNHPRIKAATSAIESSKASTKEAFSGYLPKVNATASTGYAKNDRTELEPPGSDSDLHASSYNLNFTQNLFEGFRTQASHESAKILEQAASANLDGTRQQVMFEAVATYLEVLRQIELTNLALENQNTLKNQLHMEDERVQRGSGIAVDVLQAKSRLQISKERYSAFNGALRDAMSRYMQVFGKIADIDTMELPKIPFERLPADPEEAVKLAMANNPTLVASTRNAEVAGLSRTAAQSGYYPAVDVVGTSLYDDNLQGVRGVETNDSLLVRASWQLFSGFADQARSSRASHDYNAALENTTFAQRKIAEEVKLAWSNLTTSKERADLLDNAVNIAGEVYDARKRLRDIGSDTALNVLDAENELFRAKIDAASARYDYYTSVYRMLLATGLLKLENI